MSRTAAVLALAWVMAVGCHDQAATSGPIDAWNPKLLAALEGVDGLRVRSGGTCHRERKVEKTLFETQDAKQIREAIAGLEIDEFQGGGHCMCCGDPTLEFLKGGRVVAMIGIHHGRSIRWADGPWSADGLLLAKSADRLVGWLADHGVRGPARDRANSLAGEAETKTQMERWESAMPESLLPFWRSRGMFVGPKTIGEMKAALDRALPNSNAKLLSLFRWFGSGTWNGYPEYEDDARQLLLTYPAKELFAALSSRTLTGAELDGAARLFTGREFVEDRKHDLREMPRSLREALLEYCRTSGDEEKQSAGAAAFGKAGNSSAGKSP